MKVAFFSPFNPVKSGISDFSEELLPAMKREMDIEVFASKGVVENKNIKDKFVIHDITEYHKEEIRKKFDIAVFHVGNSYDCHHELVDIYKQYGGILELHDVSLHHYLAEETMGVQDYEKYKEVMQYCHGEKGRKVAEQFLNGEIPAPWENRSFEFTVSKHLIDLAKGVIVHSDLAKQMVLGVRPDAKVINIPHHTADISRDVTKDMQAARKKLNISEDKFIFGAFGHATPSKRIVPIMEALKKYKEKNKNFHFYIVGKVGGIEIEKIIDDLNLKDNVTVTGFTSLEDFKLYMQACDIALNLRYPTQGESSGSLHRLLGMGKPILVTDIGSFREYPEGVVYKIPYGEKEIEAICDKLLYLTADKKRLTSICNNTIKYAKDSFYLPDNAVRYKNYLQAIVNDCYVNDYLDVMVERLFQFDFLDEGYLEYITKKVIWL